MSLLDEIENDPDFNPQHKNEIENAYLVDKIGGIATQIEAILLVLRAKNIVTEEEYQLAFKHIREELLLQLQLNKELDDEFTMKITERFAKKLALNR